MRFFYNGIKGSDGKLQKCYYSCGSFVHYSDSVIEITGKRYRDFSGDVHKAFKVINNTELESDYFENDRIFVEPFHPLYDQVKDAYLKQEEHKKKISTKRQEVA